MSTANRAPTRPHGLEDEAEGGELLSFTDAQNEDGPLVGPRRARLPPVISPDVAKQFELQEKQLQRACGSAPSDGRGKPNRSTRGLPRRRMRTARLGPRGAGNIADRRIGQAIASVATLGRCSSFERNRGRRPGARSQAARRGCQRSRGRYEAIRARDQLWAQRPTIEAAHGRRRRVAALRWCGGADGQIVARPGARAANLTISKGDVGIRSRARIRHPQLAGIPPALRGRRGNARRYPAHSTDAVANVGKSVAER